MPAKLLAGGMYFHLRRECTLCQGLLSGRGGSTAFHRMSRKLGPNAGRVVFLEEALVEALLESLTEHNVLLVTKKS